MGVLPLHRSRAIGLLPWPLLSCSNHHIGRVAWGAGQDQMRIVKQRLLEMIPDLKAFLDVDDLEEIGGLEGYIERTSTVLVFCSKGYFISKNCMRELVSTVQTQKPIIALMEPEALHGGLTTAEIHIQLIEAEGHYEKWGFQRETTPTGQALYDHLFAHDAIEWNRIGHFQTATMRLIANRLLPDATETTTYVDREIINRKPKPLVKPVGQFHIYCSSINLGAIELLQEVAREYGFDLHTNADSSGSAEASLSASPLERPTLRVSTRADDLPSCDCMLIYLTSRTWTRGEESVAFAEEVTKAMDDANVRLLLAHEVGVPCPHTAHTCSLSGHLGAAQLT